MAMFGRFLLFSASMFSQRIANLVKGRKLRKPTKGWKAERWRLYTVTTVGQYHPKTQWAKSC